MAVTQKDIAKQLGISRVSVGYALNGHPRVGPETRLRVQQVAQQLGYRPNRAAQALVTGRTGQIGFYHYAYGSFSDEIGHRLELSAHLASYDLLVGSVGAVENSTTPLSVDAAIFHGMVPESLIRQGFPVVSLQIDLQGSVAGPLGCYDVIQVALEEASQEAIEYLYKQGCQRIAYVSVPSAMDTFEPRYRAYSAVVKAKRGRVEEIIVESSDSLRLRADSHQAMKQYFQRHGFPDALFCSCDDIAIGAYRALRQAGRQIPQQTAVVGCDDIEESQDHSPALATIEWPFDLVCELAWRMLMERMATPSMPARYEQVKARFIPRASSQRRGFPAVASERNNSMEKS